MNSRPAAGSFRDPAGRVIHSGGQLYRILHLEAREAYLRLMESGLYDTLVADGLLVSHEAIDHPIDPAKDIWRTIKPRRLPVVSYPYEWPFSVLQDAARLTLRVQREALKRGMTLKDASAFNVQLDGCRPIFIDTLSFEPRQPGPWRAYRQFCQHFLAPLALMAYRDTRLGRLFRVYPDGIPLDLASALLPARTWAVPGLAMHLHVHARAEARLGGSPIKSATRDDPRAIEALVDSLDRTIAKLSYRPRGPWTAYESERPSYSTEAAGQKTAIVDGWLERLRPAQVWDLGANTGRFSRLAAARGAYTVALDEDAGCVDLLYREGRAAGATNLVPLVMDLAAPSPGIGWAHEERSSLRGRGPADLLLSLALVHHLAVGRGIPFSEIARYFSSLGKALIVEFVPETDPLVRPLLATTPRPAAHWSQPEFESAFARHFRTEASATISDSARRLYLMTRP